MKPVSFSQFKEIRKMTLNEFNRWLAHIFQSGAQEGYYIATENVIAEIGEEDLRQRILSVKGVGEKRADEIMEAILRNDLS